MVFVDGEMDLGSWVVNDPTVRRYVHAVGGVQTESADRQLVPPLSLVAHVLGMVLEKLAMPPGAVHSMQEMETLQPVNMGEQISAVAIMERTRRLGDMHFIPISYTLTNSAKEKVIIGKTTVLAPGDFLGNN